MKYVFIAAHQEEFPVIRLCQVLNVSESGYYAWRKREPSPRKREDESLGKLIEDAYCKSGQMVLTQRRPGAGLIHHADRGSQYTSQGYVELLQQYDIQVSMNKKGDCYDNALMESFFGTLHMTFGDLLLAML